jgi:hypothetical protein
VGRYQVSALFVGLVIAATVAAYGLLSPAQKQGSVPITLVTEDGPIAKTRPEYTGRLVFAATSLGALRSAVTASGAILACDTQPQVDQCWAKVNPPTNSLLIAAPLWPDADCFVPHLIGASVKGQIATISVDHGPSGACPGVGPDSRSMQLWSIPLSRIPRGTLTIVMRYYDQGTPQTLPQLEETTVNLN